MTVAADRAYSAAVLRPARIRQCAILAGGLGTRLGALTAATPKPALPVGGRPFLAWLMREMSRYGVEEILLLCGHLSERLREEVRAAATLLPRPLTIRFSEEPAPAGTGGALLHAAPMLDERFVLCNGDSLFACNLADTLALAARDDATELGRIVVRHTENATRSGVLECDGDLVLSFHERPPEGITDGLINAGIYVLDRRILPYLGPVCSLERDVLPVLAAGRLLRSSRAEGFFIDIGVPADYARAQHDIPQALRRPALFLDRDGVINHDLGYVGSRERFVWTGGAKAAIRRATELGWHVFIVTNQAGVARGFYDEAAVQALHAWIADEILAAGGTIDDVRYCPFHPEAVVPAYREASDWRKPGPGMLLDLIRAWELDPARCAMIGDQETDMQAAAAAGVMAHRFLGGNLLSLVERVVR